MRQARDEWKWKDKDRKVKDDKEDRQNRKYREGKEESRNIGKNGRKKCRHMRQECLEKRANGRGLKDRKVIARDFRQDKRKSVQTRQERQERQMREINSTRKSRQMRKERQVRQLIEIKQADEAGETG
jgi:hypothetical protein